MKMKKSVIPRLNAMKSMHKFTLKEILENLVFYRKNIFLFNLLWECGITVLFRRPQCEVCPTKT
jgi:hypothetical protein